MTPRVPPVRSAEAPGNIGALLQRLPDVAIFGVVAHAEGLLEPWVRYAGAVLRETELDPVLREVAILRVGGLSPQSDYVAVQHERIALELGMTAEQIAAATTGIGLHGDAALVAAFTEEVVRDVAPSDACWHATSARFSAREIVELLLVIGQYMMVVRLTATTGLRSDAAPGLAAVDAMR